MATKNHHQLAVTNHRKIFKHHATFLVTGGSDLELWLYPLAPVLKRQLELKSELPNHMIVIIENDSVTIENIQPSV